MILLLRINLIVFISFFIVGVAHSQHTPPDSLTKKKERRKWDKSHNIIDLTNDLSLKLFTLQRSNQITHHDGFTRRDITYKPNDDLNLGLGVSYKWLAFDFDVSLPSINNDDELFGKTERLHLQAEIFLHKFVIDAAYLRYRGYYGNNPQSYDPEFDSQNPIYPIRSDIGTKNLSLSTLYIFNHEKFSYRHAFTFNEIQKRSAGSFIAGAYFSTYKMSADSSLIPYQVRDEFDTTADFRGTRYISMGAAAGYAYNLILLKHLYISATLVVGLGPVLENVPELDGRPSERNVESETIGIFRVGIGYNGYKWFWGVSSFLGVGGSRDKNTSYIEREVNNVRLHIGYRMKPPKLLRRIM
ncbi:DUF4421 domain-containing protein [Reichenbachiella versicolor]|uniref:DUF4421 domain-containing protein n=1 Tax=Reichenbachiella versicolor TaxID=1821036 RepID=UPI000D6E3A02|nr:DUF4421 domain-containing protein [Reichenbachiella versicolor]